MFSVPILPFHLGTLAFVVAVVLLSDKEAFAWFRGTKPLLSLGRLRVYHRLMWAGLSLMILTGLLMFYPIAPFLLQNPAFYIKMFFVLTLVVNGFFVGKMLTVASTRTYASLSFKERLPLLISGAISICGWIGAATAAFFLE